MLGEIPLLLTVEEREQACHRQHIDDLPPFIIKNNAFIHAIETAPEFVVIDNVELSEAGSGSGALRVNVELSTYFRSTAR